MFANRLVSNVYMRLTCVRLENCRKCFSDDYTLPLPFDTIPADSYLTYLSPRKQHFTHLNPLTRLDKH